MENKGKSLRIELEQLGYELEQLGSGRRGTQNPFVIVRGFGRSEQKRLEQPFVRSDTSRGSLDVRFGRFDTAFL